MENTRMAFRLNLLLAALELFSVAWAMTGFLNGPFTAIGVGALKYFTIDSNILMGISALISALAERKVLTGETKEVPLPVQVLKLTATVSVTYTMLVTLFFLVPTMKDQYGLFGLLIYSNFFLHLFNPILAIVIFLVYEKSDKIPAKCIIFGLVPLALYSVYYLGEALSHVTDGEIDAGYDWYGMLKGGPLTVWIVVPLLAVIMLVITASLWWLNRKK